MTRVNFPEPDTAGETVREMLAGRPPLNLYRMLPRTGALAEHFLKMGAAIRHELSLEADLRELAIVRTGVITGAEYEVHHHAAIARSVGVSDEALSAVTSGDLFALPEDRRVVLTYVDALCRDVRASDEAFSGVNAILGTDALAELTMVVGFYLMVARFLLNFDIAIERELDHADWL